MQNNATSEVSLAQNLTLMVNEQDVLIIKMVLNIVNNFFMGLKISFEVWGWGSKFSKLR